MTASFRVLWAFLDGAEEYRSETLEEELAGSKLAAFRTAATRSRHGFGLLAWRNYRPEYAGRNLTLPAELLELQQLPRGEAIDRLVGHDDGPRWVPGIVGLEPQEARAFRFHDLEFQRTEDACRWLGCRPSAYYKYASEGRRKLRLYLQASA